MIWLTGRFGLTEEFVSAVPRSCGGEDQQERAWADAVLEKDYDATAFHEKNAL